MRRFVLLATTLAAGSILGTCTYGQTANNTSPAGWQTSGCGDDWGRSHNHWGDGARGCEVRRATFPLGGDHLGVTSKNGGIAVVGEDRNDVAVEARVEVRAESQEEVNSLLHQVQIETSGDQIRDSGPESRSGRTGYSVSYRLHVPRVLKTDLRTMNGGIAISHLEGDIAFDTTNGGVQLDDLAGNVHGDTVNGGLEIKLTGDRWKGEGLRARTTNGGVNLRIPQHYSAHLEAGTVNGGVSVDFPVTVQGEIKNRISTDIGSGGAVVQAETTNGGVQIRSS
ncbi:MAG: DUF4097 family beta strand repeat-containing protein [Acidobacteriaceae bacterium]